jgi:hypothetical protein
MPFLLACQKSPALRRPLLGLVIEKMTTRLTYDRLLTLRAINEHWLWRMLHRELI